MPLFRTEGLTKSFGGLRAIDSLDMHVDEGEIVSVIGPNGAGKTTFFNLVTGLEKPDDGVIEFDGQPIVGLVPSQIIKLGIARTFQNVRLFPNMTVRENVMVSRHCRTRSGLIGAVLRTPAFRREEEETRRIAEDTLGFFGTRLVGYRLDQLALVLSYANRRRLEIARAMASSPRLLLLDEPTAGMNPRETVEITELIGKMRDEKGFTILLIEHDMRVVRGVSDRVVVIDYGRKIAEGTYEEVAQNEQVIEAYLGRPAEKGA
ncbi:MAG: ABC transporter ATP-binding protein [Acidimicrobiia bacterium]|nr:ABC transporter ATP-binding protein [Acidimicrobiia bacterium]MDH3396610.1 ABC transporter ATP-binding protein [Acidimicrobiia bacterium]